MDELTDMTGRVALVTGGTSGIGQAVARRLGGLGARVAVTGRDRERGRATVAAIEEAGGEGLFFKVDFETVAAVRALAKAFQARYDRLDVLVNNAACSPGGRRLTPDGHETALAVNHLAPYVLTHDLLATLRESPWARVVNTSSTVHRRGDIDFADLRLEDGYDALDAYARSKLANLVFTTELAARLDETRVTVRAVHPGFVPKSGLYRDASLPVRAGTGLLARLPLLGTSVETAADAVVHHAAGLTDELPAGTYFSGRDPTEPDARARDERLREHLWNVSAALVDVDPAWPSLPDSIR